MPLLSVRLLGGFSAVDHRGNAPSIARPRMQASMFYPALKRDMVTME